MPFSGGSEDKKLSPGIKRKAIYLTLVALVIEVDTGPWLRPAGV
jgi:hypothetical protein